MNEFKYNDDECLLNWTASRTILLEQRKNFFSTTFANLIDLNFIKNK